MRMHVCECVCICSVLLKPGHVKCCRGFGSSGKGLGPLMPFHPSHTTTQLHTNTHPQTQTPRDTGPYPVTSGQSQDCPCGLNILFNRYLFVLSSLLSLFSSLLSF